MRPRVVLPVGNAPPPEPTPSKVMSEGIASDPNSPMSRPTLTVHQPLSPNVRQFCRASIVEAPVPRVPVDAVVTPGQKPIVQPMSQPACRDLAPQTRAAGSRPGS